MDDHIKKYLTALVLFVVLPSSSMAASLWSDIATSQAAPALELKQLSPNPHANSRRVSVDHTQLKSALAAANALPAGQAAKTLAPAQIEIPMPDGSQQVFNIVESSVMAPALAAKYPQIKTYKATAENDASISGRLEMTPNGFHGYVFTSKGEVLIDPIPSSQDQYYSYYKRDYASIQPKQFSCGVKPKSASESSATESPVAEFKTAEFVTAARTSGSMISYRIAVAATGEYSQAVAGGNAVDTLAAIVIAIDRINEIYERDLAIRLVLIADNDLIIYTNANTDPYTDPTDPSRLIEENQTALDSALGSSAYDIGHVFNTDGGGLAGLGVACWEGYKARGESGHPDPTGDPYYIDIVAHEIGHQLGANHTFNGTTESCAGNRNAETAYEPGSGSTIMSYAGICGVEDVTTYADATFHGGSIAEIIDYTRLDVGNTCDGTLAGQTAPIVNAGQDYTIPGGTAFTLKAAPESNAITYQWDQMDAGTATTASTYGIDNGSNALFRSFLPVSTSERNFPQISTLLSNVADKAETVPTENRSLNFRLTGRNGSGGVDEDDMQIVVDGEAGPFEVIQPNTNVNLDPSLPQIIEWNTACTDTAPVSCLNVDILVSVDGGQTYSSAVSGSTTNDGSQSVTLSNAANVTAATDTTTARIKIICTNNIFFDVSDVDFRINGTTGVSITETNTPPSCGTATGGVIITDEKEPNNFPNQAQSIVIPSTINGTSNDILDPDDYFEFVADHLMYSFTLSNYGSHDLDLYLLDDAEETIAKSDSYNTTETISKVLVAGQTYYVVVNGFETSEQDAPYTLSVQTKPVPTSSGGGGGAIAYSWLALMLISLLFRQHRTA